MIKSVRSALIVIAKVLTAAIMITVMTVIAAAILMKI